MSTTQASPGTINRLTATGWRAPLSPAVLGLSALLALQLLAALALGLGGKDMEPAGTQGPLLAFDPNRVTGLRIDIPAGEPVLVTKIESGWVIPTLGDLPAARSKVNDLLAKLGGLEKGLPIATSEEALARFKVSDQVFERKLTLESDGPTPAVLYLGDSPGYRRLFARVQGDSAVYEAQLGLFDAPDKPDAWSDRTLLYLDTDKVHRLTLDGLSLGRADDGWRLEGLAEGEQQDADAIGDLARMLTRIDFVGVLAPEDQPAISQDVPPIEIGAALKSGEAISYRVSKLDQSDDYLLEASNRPQRFKLAAYSVGELGAIGRADLLAISENQDEADPAAGPPAATTPASEARPAAASAETGDVRGAPDTVSPEFPTTSEAPAPVPDERNE